MEDGTPQEEITQNKVDTQHEPHSNAQPRLLVSIGAVIVVILIIALVVWPRWGESIKEACLGDGEVCKVELPESFKEGEAGFDMPLKEFANE